MNTSAPSKHHAKKELDHLMYLIHGIATLNLLLSLGDTIRCRTPSSTLRKIPIPAPILTLSPPLLAPLPHRASYLLANLFQTCFRADGAKALYRESCTASFPTTRATSTATSTWRPRSEEANVAEVVK